LAVAPVPILFFMNACSVLVSAEIRDRGQPRPAQRRFSLFSAFDFDGPGDKQLAIGGCGPDRPRANRPWSKTGQLNSLSTQLAELDLGIMKVRQKISRCFRPAAGAENFATPRAVISTARNQGWSLIETLQQRPDALIANINTVWLTWGII
jgi:hypothetical protein